jgi:hypothetical protein
MPHLMQSIAVEPLLRELERDAERIRKVTIEAVIPPGSPMFPLDVLALAAAKRHASTTSAFVAMVRALNMVVARALLRMHIDTALRFSAAWHVAEPQTFAVQVLKGERIDKLKTRKGVRLTDAHLVDLHKDKHPWLPEVYERLSGYVHFSSSHISDSIVRLGEEGGENKIQFLVSGEDLKFSEFTWTEVLKCFREASSILATYLQGWGETKKLSEVQLKALRGDSSEETHPK